MPDIFGLPGIFDNVRDGLVLVRLPEGEIVLFNRAASEMCGVSVAMAMGTDYGDIFLGPVQALARASGEQAVGEWPGHDQTALRTQIHTPEGDSQIELHVCRVEDAGEGGPLVLLVMRPVGEAVLAATIRNAAKAHAVEAA